jgi:hypothetical protein
MVQNRGMSVILQPEDEEYVTPYLKRYWLKAGRIVVYEIIAGDANTGEEWFNLVLQTLAGWSTDKPYLEIHVMNNSQPRPGDQQRALNLARRMAAYQGRSAIVISKSGGGRLMSYFVNHVFKPFTGNMQRRVCFSIEEALDWLLADD